MNTFDPQSFAMGILVGIVAAIFLGALLTSDDDTPEEPKHE